MEEKPHVGGSDQKMKPKVGNMQLNQCCLLRAFALRKLSALTNPILEGYYGVHRSHSNKMQPCQQLFQGFPSLQLGFSRDLLAFSFGLQTSIFSFFNGQGMSKIFS